MRQRDIALLLDAGIVALPARGKRPTVDWRQFQHVRPTPEQTRAWFANGHSPNVWILCGRISELVVLDCDNDRTRGWWRERIGAEMDATTCVRTARGAHYWFRTTDGEWPSWSKHEDGLDFEVRGEGGGVIAPPSRHDSGEAYQFIRGLDHLQAAPEALRQPTKEAKPAASIGGLAGLLAGPPDDPRKGNTWMTEVLGHLRRAGFGGDDLRGLAVAVQQSLTEPLPPADLDKMLDQANGWSDGFENRVSQQVETLRVREEAERRHRAGNWRQPRRFDLMAEVPAEPEHLGVGGFLLRPSLVWLFGEPETGKSVLAYDAAVRELRQRRPVLLFDAEAGEADVRQKMRALGASDDDLTLLFAFDVAGTDLMLHPAWPLEAKTRVGARLAIFDSAAALLAAAGLNENDAPEVLGFISRVLRPLVRDADSTVVVLDHVTKSEPGSRYPRASGSKLGESDLAYNVAAPEPFARGRSGRMRLRCVKDRSGFIGRETQFDISVGATEDGRLSLDASRMTREEAEALQALARASGKNAAVEALGDGPKTVAELQAATGLSRNRVSALLNEAKASGQVADDGPRHGFAKAWRLVP